MLGAFGVVEDKGFILIIPRRLLRGLLLGLHTKLLLGVLMEEAASRHIIPLPDTGSGIEYGCELILLLLLLLILALPLLRSINIGEKHRQCVGLPALTTTA